VRGVGLLLGLALALGAAQGEEETATHQAKVVRFLEVSGRAEVGKAMLQAALAKRELPQKVVDAAWKLAELEAFQARLVEAYADLDDATLDAAIAFYGTDAGKRLAQVQAQHDARVQAEAREWLSRLDRALKGRYGVSLLEGPKKTPRRAPPVPAEPDVAIGALKTVNTAQALFREGDKDGDGVFDYGTLSDLGATNLIDAKLAAGEKGGYRFEVCVGSEAPEFLWMMVAKPIDPNSGAPCFATNQAGVIFESSTPFVLDRAKCVIPQGAGTPAVR